MVNIVLIGIGFSLLYYWMFFATGSIVINLFKIKAGNNFIAIALGCFAYFFIIALTLLLLEFTNIPYKILLYYLIAIHLLYVLFLLLFFKFWWNFQLLNWKHMFFVIVFLMFIGLYYLKDLFINHSFDQTNQYGDFINWYKNIIVQLNVNETNEMLKITAWYTNISMWLFITRIEPEMFLANIIGMIDAMIFASLFMAMISNFSTGKSKLVIGTISLFVFLATKILLYYLGYFLWEGKTMFLNLLLTAIFFIVHYQKTNYRMLNTPWAISLIFASYIAFDWKNSYIVLILIYATSWIILWTYKNSFLKDLTKLTLLSNINFILYNIIVSKNLILMFVFLALFVTIILLSFMLSYKYTYFSQVETYFYKNRKLLILLIPAIFLLLAVAWWLATGETGFGYWKVKNISMQVFNELSKKFSEQLIDNVALISAIALNVLSLIWILITEQFKYSVGKTAVDIGAILIVTFFNPYASSFLISFLKNDIFLTNGILLTAVFVSLVNLMVYQINCQPLKIEKSGRLKSLFYNKYHVILK